MERIGENEVINCLRFIKNGKVMKITILFRGSPLHLSSDFKHTKTNSYSTMPNYASISPAYFGLTSIFVVKLCLFLVLWHYNDRNCISYSSPVYVWEAIQHFRCEFFRQSDCRNLVLTSRKQIRLWWNELYAVLHWGRTIIRVMGGEGGRDETKKLHKEERKSYEKESEEIFVKHIIFVSLQKMNSLEYLEWKQCAIYAILN